ncbi:MAG: hypothetical protein AW09_004596 [Candidatus Accumulibacter phosphatis]|uniref:Uncharacterized protein n=1 Tax=Candidatus Accumulibacter phosphatis TaxID=327160 RepID=A0A084Y6G8_9PROT|nr:MAG: hypothetical protein AW09_004596 [Candidatus Accumulibacter phosphatis]
MVASSALVESAPSAVFTAKKFVNMSDEAARPRVLEPSGAKPAVMFTVIGSMNTLCQ